MKKKKPNKIILVVVDALRFDTSRILWPLFNNIFTQHYTSNNWTLPAVTTMLTGTNNHNKHYYKPIRISKVHDALAGEINKPTVGKYLKDKGWITFGSTDSSFMTEHFGYGKKDEWTLWKYRPDCNGSKLGTPLFIDDSKEFRFYHDYFLHNYFEDARETKDKTKTVKVKHGGAIKINYWVGRVDIERWESEYWKRCHRVYNMLKWIPKSDAIVIVTSDHGESFYEYGNNFSHQECHLSEEIAHVPLLIHWPGVTGGRIRELTRDIDITPTILDMAGENKKLDGKSLVPLMQGKQQTPREHRGTYVHKSKQIWSFHFTQTEKKLNFVKKMNK